MSVTSEVRGAGSQRPDWTKRLGGSWKNSDVPWQGWECEDIEPAQAGEVCEMCRQGKGRRIRHAYIMTHPDHGRPLRCGSNCAWLMEEGAALQAGTPVTDGADGNGRHSRHA